MSPHDGENRLLLGELTGEPVKVRGEKTIGLTVGDHGQRFRESLAVVIVGFAGRLTWHG